MQIATLVEITPQRVADMMVTAIEGTPCTRAWCEGIYAYGDSIAKADACKERPWYSDPAFWTGPFTIDVVEIEDDGYTHHTITEYHFERGLQVLADKYTHHWRDLVDENDDAITADIMLQCIVFGEEKYG